MKYRAEISKCGDYRYRLERTWDEGKSKALFIMLNPSVANGDINDMTTIRCINFARSWGYGGIVIGNLFPYRAKRPRDLKRWLKDTSVLSYGAKRTNKTYVREMVGEADVIVGAWGCNRKGLPEWVRDMCEEVDKDLHYLALCDDGVTPKHPLGNLSCDLTPNKYVFHKLNTNTNG